ncbi:MAG: site-specific DNA-methyltransferase [Deltaproteobacteria bacterium]|nr:site-specific DNA-methyltransferase [Deltaproteobacteria bacterium]
MRKWYRNSHYTIYNADSLEWVSSQRANSFHAVVTDPPFGLVEYTAKELNKRRRRRGGIWRLPQAFDGANRQPLPRFTVLNGHDRMGVLAFHLRLAPELFRILVPGAHVILSSQCLISHLVVEAFCMAGFEARGQIVRVVKTFRGGDRPKFGDKQYPNVSVIPRSCFEPWLLFRKPCQGRVVDNLKRFGTGALRRPSQDIPFCDLVEIPSARPVERLLARHPSLKPQALMRFLVRASLPLAKGVVLDPFMGAGSTIAAAVHLGLKSVGVELDPKYFSMAKSAIPKLAGFEINGSA